MNCAIQFLGYFLCLGGFKFTDSQKYDIQNEIQGSLDTSSSLSKACCDCDYSDLLTRFIEAIGNDELAKRFEFRGMPGPEGPIGPEGLEGRPGKKGEIGEMGPIGPPGERGYRGEPGRPGKHGQKGEPADLLIYRQLPGQRVIQLKGEKGAIGNRGIKGDRGLPGLTVVGQKGETGTPAEFSEELKQSLKGEKGERGLVGRSVNCQSCNRARRGRNKNKEANDEARKIYIPVQGPPGKDIVGVGQKGEPGEPGRVIKNPVTVLSYEDELSKLFDPDSMGTLAFVRASETLFIQTDRGWKEISFTGRFIDPYAYRRRHRHTRNKNKF